MLRFFIDKTPITLGSQSTAKKIIEHILYLCKQKNRNDDLELDTKNVRIINQKKIILFLSKLIEKTIKYNIYQKNLGDLDKYNIRKAFAETIFNFTETIGGIHFPIKQNCNDLYHPPVKKCEYAAFPDRLFSSQLYLEQHLIDQLKKQYKNFLNDSLVDTGLCFAMFCINNSVPRDIYNVLMGYYAQLNSIHSMMNSERISGQIFDYVSDNHDLEKDFVFVNSPVNRNPQNQRMT